MLKNKLHSVTTLVDLLREQAGKRGDQTLYTYLGDDSAASYTLSYRELDQQAQCIAAQLQSLNAKGERALLLYPSNLDFLAGFFGALYAGVVAVPAYPPRKNQNTDRLRAIIRDSDARYVLASSQVMRVAQPLLQEMAEFSDLTFIATDELPTSMAEDWVPLQITTDSLAFLQYTSGSTGDPKGVMLSHGNLLYNQEMIRVGVTNNVSGGYVSWLPLFHDMGLGTAVQALYRGEEGCLMAPATFIRRPQRWLWAISDNKAAISGGPNFAYDLCVKTFKPELYEGLDLSTWRVAFNGAEPIKASTLEAFSRTFSPYGFKHEAFQPCYGLAEATVGVSSGDGGAVLTKEVSQEALQGHRVDEEVVNQDDGKHIVACGHTWLDDALRIVNPETCEAAKAHEVGEIWLSSPSVGAGYWQRPELSDATFRAKIIASAPGGDSSQDERGYLRTGDLGFYVENQLYITGRIKELLIIRGRNYYPADLEQCVASVCEALIQNCIAAFNVEYEGDEHLVLVCEVERRHLRSFNAETLRQTICQAVAEQFELRVESVVFVKPGRIPKTSSGKLQRGLCSEQFLQGRIETISAWVGSSLEPLYSRLNPAVRSGGSAKTKASSRVSVAAPKSVKTGDKETQKIKEWLTQWFADQLELPEVMIDPAKNLASLGVDSLLVMRTSGELSHLLGCSLPPDLLWEYPTINQLSEVLVEQQTMTLSEIEPWLDSHSKSDIYFPASAAQKRHWLMHQFKHLKSAYNLSAAYRLQGDLDVEALRLSFQALVHRHSGLRTVFEVKDGVLSQRILPINNFLLQFDDITSLPNRVLEKKSALLLGEESGYQFDLSKGPLFRARLLHLAPESYVLLLNVHHIIADGWSVEFLLKELSQHYASRVAKKGIEPPAKPALQYVDYLRWREQYESPEMLEKQLEYWKTKLASSPVLELRADFPRPAEPTGAGARYHFDLPPSLERTLRELCVREEVTLYHLMLAGLSLLLSRYARQDIVSIGSPAANRPHRDLTTVAGVFVNTLVMRNNLSGNPSFDELLKRVKKTAQDAYNHQDLPFEELVSAMGAGGDLSYSPLFQVMLVVQPFSLEESLALQGLAVTPMNLELESAKFDLGFEFRQHNGALRGTLEYRTDLFAAETAELMVNHYIELLRQIVREPKAPIDTISMVAQSERHNLLRLANSENRCPSPDHTLVEVLERQAEQRAESIALRYRDEQLSYQNLNQRANQIAHSLIDQGVKPGDLVGLSIARSLDLVVAMIAIMKVGAAYVPVDPESPAKRAKMIFEDANVRALIVHSSRKENFSDMPHCLLVDALDLDAYPVSNIRYRGSVEDTAYVIYTSGTTGKPKGVIVSHRNVVRLFSETDDQFHFNEKDVWTLFHSYGFDFSVWEIWGALLYGGKLVVVPHWVKRSPSQFSKLLVDEKVTVLNQTPAAFYALSKEMVSMAVRPNLRLRYVVFGGDALETQKIRPWVDKLGLDKPQLINMYGITETTVHVTHHRVQHKDFEQLISPIGRPIPDNQLYILDDVGSLCPMGVPGEIHVGGGGVTKGYLNRDALNKERFVPNPFSNKKGEKLYRSGDLAFYNKDGLLCYLRRIDQQVKVRGYRIELGDIENCLNELSSASNDKQFSIRACAVLTAPDRSGEKQLVAYLVGTQTIDEQADQKIDKNNEREFIATVRSHVERLLPTYMIPSKYILIEELPLTLNGKLDKQKLLVINYDAAKVSVDAQAKTEMENYLVCLWGDMLGVTPIGIDDSFFELGGHSLLATQILNQIREVHEVEVPTSEIFKRPTIRQLGQYIDTVLSVKKRSDEQSANDDEDREEYEL
ncbi:MAG: amino acid adenylation domain-containing protein [Gammaproteobacteria bacterium]|nr:amino acid adenylation domain-containing protein [Gammaproteobacteria bacterium]